MKKNSTLRRFGGWHPWMMTGKFWVFFFVAEQAFGVISFFLGLAGNPGCQD